MKLRKIVGFAAPIVAAVVLVACLILTRGQLATLQTGAVVLGRQGEWVTRPDGRRVCRLSADLTIYHAIGPAFCTDWQEPMPEVGQTVNGWIRSDEGRYQIMIEGRWRP